jgi:tetratricopeptide (TPR) repeat protein
MKAADDHEAALAVAAGANADCAELSLARLALEGWNHARGLAPKGGDKALLRPVNGILRELSTLRDRVAARPAVGRGENRLLALELDYADAAIRAAIDAAQDERSEMAVYLDHARQLSRLLDAGGRPPVWPAPFDELEGELWFEVDRYAEARAAFQRAASREDTPRALLFIARIAVREGDAATACDFYRRLLALTPSPAARDEAEVYAATCR